MDDRKTQTMVTRLVKAKKDIDDIKTTQLVGADNTRLKLLSSVDAYDYSISIPSTGTTRLDCDLRYFPLDLEPWQVSDYSEIYIQYWVGNMSTPYNGTKNRDLIIFDIRNNISLFVNQARWQINNVKASAQTVYMKFYIISTAPNGTLTFTGTLI